MSKLQPLLNARPQLRTEPQLQQSQILFLTTNTPSYPTPEEQGKREIAPGCFHFKRQPGA